MTGHEEFMKIPEDLPVAVSIITPGLYKGNNLFKKDNSPDKALTSVIGEIFL